MASNAVPGSKGGGCVGTLVSVAVVIAIVTMLIKDPAGTAASAGAVIDWIRHAISAFVTFGRDLLGSQGGGA